MFGGRLAYVPESIIKVLREGADPQSGLYRLPQVTFQKGDSVKVTSGAFEGLRGVFYMPSAADRVLILLDVLGTTSTVNLPRIDLVLA